jgi:hypothetical protein
VDTEQRAEIRVFLDPEIERLLVENETDVVDLLRRNGADVARGTSSTPTGGSGEKEPVTIILAAAGLAVALTPLLTRALALLSHKQVLVTEKVPVAVADAHGEVVRDAAGEPVVEWVDRARFVETRAQRDPAQSLELDGLGLRVSYQSTSSSAAP